VGLYTELLYAIIDPYFFYAFCWTAITTSIALINSETSYFLRARVCIQQLDLRASVTELWQWSIFIRSNFNGIIMGIYSMPWLKLVPLLHFQPLVVWAAYQDGQIWQAPSRLTGLLHRGPMELSCSIILCSQTLVATLLLLLLLWIAVMSSLLTLPMIDLVSYVGIDYALYITTCTMHNYFPCTIQTVSCLWSAKHKPTRARKLYFLLEATIAVKLTMTLHRPGCTLLRSHISKLTAMQLLVNWYIYRMYCFTVEFTIYSKQCLYTECISYFCPVV